MAPVRAALRRPLRPTPRRRPARAAWGTPPSRMSKSSPAAETRITPLDWVPGTKLFEASWRMPLGREQEEENQRGCPGAPR